MLRLTNKLAWFLLMLIYLFSCQTEDILELKDPVLYLGPNITFAIIGDYGKAGKPAKLVSELVDSWDPSFIITTGDNNYPNGALNTIRQNISQYYYDYIFNPNAPKNMECLGKSHIDQTNRFFPTLGNHDQDNPIGNNPYLAFFDLPGREDRYDFVQGSVHFFTFDSNLAKEENCCKSGQAGWLKEKLSQSTALFKVVYLHHSPYSNSEHESEKSLQWPFEKWGVDLVISGHNHVYEHFTPNEKTEPHYITNGIGGSPYLSECESISNIDLLDYNYFCSNENHGAIRGIIEGDRIQFSVFHIDNPNTPFDFWAIEK